MNPKPSHQSEKSLSLPLPKENEVEDKESNGGDLEGESYATLVGRESKRKLVSSNEAGNRVDCRLNDF